MIITLITIVHVLVCIFLVAVVLLQSGKGGDLAATFAGGGSQTAFGPRAAANTLSRATTWAAVIFMITSFTLMILVSRGSSSSNSVLGGEKTSQSAPAKK
jgi:preprotein translocase subunit SecG